ncbi:MAG: rRNA maturation RNase YbeY [Pedosphaera sp.]|nr:rRNA maturation RNase YbeY [Pedosphaera sp.]
MTNPRIDGPAMGAAIVWVSNRQRYRPVNGRTIQRLAEETLRKLSATGEIGIHLVTSKRMASVNEQYLRHTGSTDVITFDHGSTPGHLHGELFICVVEAVDQAREFRTTWRQELVRYVIHGLLHLCSFDDLEPVKRRRMKRVENRLVRWWESGHRTRSQGVVSPSLARRRRRKLPSRG